jgi:hypothetical protein
MVTLERLLDIIVTDTMRTRKYTKIQKTNIVAMCNQLLDGNKIIFIEYRFYHEICLEGYHIFKFLSMNLPQYDFYYYNNKKTQFQPPKPNQIIIYDISDDKLIRHYNEFYKTTRVLINSTSSIIHFQRKVKEYLYAPKSGNMFKQCKKDYNRYVL